MHDGAPGCCVETLFIPALLACLPFQPKQLTLGLEVDEIQQVLGAVHPQIQSGAISGGASRARRWDEKHRRGDSKCGTKTSSL